MRRWSQGSGRGKGEGGDTEEEEEESAKGEEGGDRETKEVLYYVSILIYQ